LTIKVIALWGAPTDVDGFEKEYASTHLPLVPGIPGLKGAIASKVLDGPYYRVAELIFEDQDGLQLGLGSEAGQKLVADSGRLQATYGAKLELFDGGGRGPQLSHARFGACSRNLKPLTLPVGSMA